MALVGSTRFEGVRGTRWTFTASGSVTNLAARLAAAARSGQVLAGPETVRRLEDRYHLEPLGRESLKNIVEPVEIHRILGRHVKRPGNGHSAEAPGASAEHGGDENRRAVS